MTAPAKKDVQKEAPYEPQIDSVQEYLGQMLYDQAMNFIQYQICRLDECNLAERREQENALFNLSQYAMPIPNTNEDVVQPELVAYCVDRFLRIDRDDHTITRGSCSIIVINKETAAPAYFATAYLTKQLNGNIVVTPMSDERPTYRDAYRINIGGFTEKDV